MLRRKGSRATRALVIVGLVSLALFLSMPSKTNLKNTTSITAVEYGKAPGADASGLLPNRAIECYMAGTRGQPQTKSPLEFATTIVTGFFQIPNKHSGNDFKNWISNFMNIETAVVVFTNNANTARELEELRHKRLHHLLYICIMPLEELDAYKDYGHAKWQEQEKVDPELRYHHGYHLYLVWLGKVEFILKAAEMNVFNSKYFMWNDIGGFRSFDEVKPNIKGWPDPKQVELVCGEKIAWILMEPYFLDHCGLGEFTTPAAFKDDFRFNFEKKVFAAGRSFTVAGSPQCGTPENFLKYYDYFKRVLRLHIESGAFAGKDQTLMALIALTRPNMINLVKPLHQNWFYFNELLRPGGAPHNPPQFLACTK